MDLIWRNKFHFIMIFVVVLLITILFYVFATPKYKSIVILFPSATSSISQSLITDNQQKNSILQFGEETDVEQLIQIASSSIVKEKLINQFNLFEHYKIDKNSKYPKTQITREYESNVKIAKTRNMAVEIEVLDASSDTAALIANAIVKIIDTIYNNVQKERAQKAFEIVENEFISQKNKLKAIEDSLTKLGELGVLDIRSQSEMYSEQQAIAILTGNQRALEEINKKIDVLAKYGNIHSVLIEQMTEEVKRLSMLEAKYREAKIDVEQDLPNTYVVSAAEIAEKKHSPNLFLMIFANLILDILSCFVLVLILVKYKKYFKPNNKNEK
ncbi:MAG: hypothetical protein LBV69_11760 [Bacteroidales bacterium]|nr:hypothetical protein [Bacteroidales bacterium]